MKKIIILIVIILAVLGLYWFFNSMNNPSSKGNSASSTLNSLFPYGLSDNTSTGSVSNNNQNNSGSSTNNQGGTANTSQSYNPLVQLSTRSIVGMALISPAPYSLISTSTKNNTVNLAPADLSYRSTIFDKTTLPVVRFAEHGTGYIYDVDARAQNETKQTGTTIVRVMEAYFGNYGNNVIFRYVKNDNSTIETFLGKIISPVDGNTGQYASIKGDFLPENISNVVVSPDAKSFAYLISTNTGSSAITQAMDETNKTQIFSSSFDEWLLDWKDNILTATTKAASGIPSFVYQIGNTGIFQKIIGGIDGMTTNISPDGKSLLYNSSDSGKLSFFVRHSNGDSTKLNISTLPEKCVWSKKSIIAYCAVPNYLSDSGLYPDDWYQGTMHFNDSIFKVDTGLGTATKISDLDSRQIDAVNLLLDQNENFLLFKNNNDGTPWSLDLRPVKPASNIPTLSPFPAVNKTN